MNFLSNNIRFLRRSQKWSQEELGKRLGVKRSSIAAYESKDVQPRLDFVIALSRLFQTPIAALIEENLELTRSFGGPTASAESQSTIQDTPAFSPPFETTNTDNLSHLSQQSNGIRTMLDGLKVFYRYKLDSLNSNDVQVRRLSADIDNLLLLMEHLATHNEALLRALGQNENWLPPE
jgi:transcriptional regulator with XRE-family HTH domain